MNKHRREEVRFGMTNTQTGRSPLWTDGKRKQTRSTNWDGQTHRRGEVSFWMDEHKREEQMRERERGGGERERERALFTRVIDEHIFI